MVSTTVISTDWYQPLWYQLISYQPLWYQPLCMDLMTIISTALIFSSMISITMIQIAMILIGLIPANIMAWYQLLWYAVTPDCRHFHYFRCCHHFRCVQHFLRETIYRSWGDRREETGVSWIGELPVLNRHTNTELVSWLNLKLHSPITFKSLHYFEINMSDRPW